MENRKRRNLLALLACFVILSFPWESTNKIEKRNNEILKQAQQIEYSNKLKELEKKLEESKSSESKYKLFYDKVSPNLIAYLKLYDRIEVDKKRRNELVKKAELNFNPPLYENQLSIILWGEQKKAYEEDYLGLSKQEFEEYGDLLEKEILYFRFVREFNLKFRTLGKECFENKNPSEEELDSQKLYK